MFLQECCAKLLPQDRGILNKFVLSPEHSIRFHQALEHWRHQLGDTPAGPVLVETKGSIGQLTPQLTDLQQLRVIPSEHGDRLVNSA